MATTNMSSIISKVGAYSRSVEGKLRMKEKIEQYKRDGIRKTAGGGDIITRTMMIEAAAKLIKVLQNTAHEYSLPPSVMQHFYNLSCSEPKNMPDGSTTIYVYFGGDLHRDSLEDGDGYYGNRFGGYTGEGINNIVALLNNGAHAKNYTYGWWNGHSATGAAVTRSGAGSGFAWVKSKKDREALHFIQQAVQDFNGNYGADFNVTAVAGDDYQT